MPQGDPVAEYLRRYGGPRDDAVSRYLSRYGTQQEAGPMVAAPTYARPPGAPAPAVVPPEQRQESGVVKYARGMSRLIRGAQDRPLETVAGAAEAGYRLARGAVEFPIQVANVATRALGRVMGKNAVEQIQEEIRALESGPTRQRLITIGLDPDVRIRQLRQQLEAAKVAPLPEAESEVAGLITGPFHMAREAVAGIQELGEKNRPVAPGDIRRNLARTVETGAVLTGLAEGGVRVARRLTGGVPQAPAEVPFTPQQREAVGRAAAAQQLLEEAGVRVPDETLPEVGRVLEAQAEAAPASPQLELGAQAGEPGVTSAIGTPQRAATSSETQGALSTSPTVPPGTQRPLSQSSETTRPSGVSTVRPMTPPPRLPAEETIREIGAIEPSSGKIIAQTTDDVHALVNRAQAEEPAYRKTLEDVVGEVEGTTLFGARAKPLASALRKAADQKRPASTLQDYLGGRVGLASIPQADEVLAALERRGWRVLEDEPFFDKPKAGYRARHVNLVHPNGDFSVELQLVPREIMAVQEDAHHFYDLMRDQNVSEEVRDWATRATNGIFNRAWADYLRRHNLPVPAEFGEVTAEARAALHHPPQARAPPEGPLREVARQAEEMGVAMGSAAQKIRRAQERAPTIAPTKPAAIKVGDRVFRGQQHFDARNVAIETLGEAKYDAAVRAGQVDEGFVDAQGRYFSRDEAMQRFGSDATEEVVQRAREQAPPEEPPPVEVRGRTAPVVTPSGTSEATYAVVEANHVIPSHRYDTFKPREAYPAGVQERQYHRDPAEQLKVIQHAQGFDPRFIVTDNPDAVNGPPIVTPDGFVLGGNSRAMSMQRLYAEGRGDILKQALVERAAQFGLDPAQVARMRQPIPVRMIPDVPTAQMPELVRRFNEVPTQELGSAAQAVAHARRVSPETLGTLAETMKPDETLAAYLGSPANQKAMIARLTEDGVLTAQNRNRYVQGGYLNAEGKALVERVLLGKVIEDPTLLDTAPPYLLQRVGKLVATIAQSIEVGPEWDLRPALTEALSKAREAAGAEISRKEWLQPGLFGKREIGQAAETLWTLIDELPIKDVRRRFAEYAEHAREALPAARGQTNLDALTGPRLSPAEAFAVAFMPRSGAASQGVFSILNNERGSTFIAPDVIGEAAHQAMPEHSRRIQNRIVVGHTPREFKPLDMIVNLARRAREAISRGTMPIERFEKALIEDLRNPPVLGPAAAARLVSHSSARAAAFFENGTFRVNNQTGEIIWTGPSLEARLAPLAHVPDAANALRRYEVAEATIERGKLGKATGVELKDAEAEVAGAHPIVKRVHQSLVDFRNQAMQYWVDAGGASVETSAFLEQLYRHYVPLRRVFKGDPVAMGVGGPGRVRQVLRRTAKEGSSRLIHDPLVSTIEMTTRLIRAADHNRVVQQMARFTDAAPEAARGMMERVAVKRNRAPTLEASRLRQAAEARGIKMGEEQAAELADVFSDRQLDYSDRVVHVWRDGKQIAYRVSPELARSLRSIGPQQLPMLIRLLGGPAQLAKAGITLPFRFAMFNWLRDTATAALQSQNNFVPFLDSLRGILLQLRKDPLVGEYRAAGGGFQTLVPSARSVRSQLRRALPKPPARAATIAVMHPLEMMREFGRVLEESTRIGEFAKARGRGYDATRAALFANEVSVDFGARGGATMQALNHMTAFLNPGIQSLETAFRVVKNHPKRLMAVGVGAVTLPSIALWVANHGDQEIDDLRKTQWGTLFWFARLPNGRLVRFPKPFVWGQVFGTGIEAVLDNFADHDPAAAKRFAEGLAQSLAVNMVPNVMETVVALARNKVPYFRNPIIPPELENVEARYQAADYTSRIARKAGELINVSPAHIEFVYNELTGTLGRQVLQWADRGVNALTGASDVQLPLGVRDVPFIGGFFVQPVSSNVEPVRTFYEEAQRLERIWTTDRFLQRQAEEDPNALDKYSAYHEAHDLDLSLVPVYRGALEDLRSQRNGLEAIRSMPREALDPKRRVELTESILKGMIESARAVNLGMRPVREEPK